MIKVLVDTCVWIDLLDDYRMRPRLKAFIHLVRQGEMDLILPQLVVDEFQRNKYNTLKAISGGFANQINTTGKLARKFMRTPPSMDVARHLEDLSEQMKREGEAAAREIGEVEQFFKSVPLLQTTDDARIRASRRAERKLAPFHNTRNSMADALILEVFREAMEADPDPDNLFVFVTSNHTDFSQPEGDRRTHHTDLTEFFPAPRARYATDLSSILAPFGQDLVDRYTPAEFDEPRRKTEVMDMIDRLEDIHRYHEIRAREALVEAGRLVVVEDDPRGRRNRLPVGQIRRSAVERHRRQLATLEAKLDDDDKRELDEYERGELAGRMAALEWLLGEEWDGASFSTMGAGRAPE